MRTIVLSTACEPVLVLDRTPLKNIEEVKGIDAMLYVRVERIMKN